jgi:hypothetical protein
MNVSTRPKSSDNLARRMRTRRLSPRGLHYPRAGAPAESPSSTDPSVAPSAQAPRSDEDGQARTVDDAGQSLDLASYSCACGYVFEAQVSTTVACPHCGSNQAW